MLISRRRQQQLTESKVVEVKEFKPEQSISKKETVHYEEMTKAEIKELLDLKGIKYNDRDNKATLIGLLK